MAETTLTAAERQNLLNVDRVRVRAFSLDRLVVDWRIKPTNLNVSNYTFSVLRSQTPEGPFVVIRDDIKSIFSFHDPKASQKARWRQWYYKIRVTEDDTSNFCDSEISSNDEKPDRIALAIIKKNDMILREKVGLEVFVLVERTFGQRCGVCYDTIKNRRKTDQCTTCFNTGFRGGFFDPIKIRANFSPSAKVMQFSNFGEIQPNQTSAWISNFPEVKPRDIIVESHDGRRWRIQRVTPTRKLRSVVHQNLLLTEINRSDIEWKIQITELIEP